MKPPRKPAWPKDGEYAHCFHNNPCSVHPEAVVVMAARLCSNEVLVLRDWLTRWLAAYDARSTK